MSFSLRVATFSDVPILLRLIDASVRGLQTDDYTPEQIEGALESAYGVDSQLIADGTFFVVQEGSAPGSPIVACGGWSRHKTLCGGDQCAGRDDDLLDPVLDAAKIRAFFVHPKWARHGIGSMILTACESAAREAGFRRLEMGATLTGVPFYQARGYESAERLGVPMACGEDLPIVRMVKSFP